MDPTGDKICVKMPRQPIATRGPDRDSTVTPDTALYLIDIRRTGHPVQHACCGVESFCFGLGDLHRAALSKHQRHDMSPLTLPRSTTPDCPHSAVVFCPRAI